MDFNEWLSAIKLDEKKYNLYRLHKKHFWRSRLAILIDMVLIIALSVFSVKSFGFLSSTPAPKNFLLLFLFMILFYLLLISIPLSNFGKTVGLFLTGLVAISSETLEYPSFKETYWYIGQDKRYQKDYPIRIFLVPDDYLR